MNNPILIHMCCSQNKSMNQVNHLNQDPSSLSRSLVQNRSHINIWLVRMPHCCDDWYIGKEMSSQKKTGMQSKSKSKQKKKRASL